MNVKILILGFAAVICQASGHQRFGNEYSRPTNFQWQQQSSGPFRPIGSFISQLFRPPISPIWPQGLGLSPLLQFIYGQRPPQYPFQSYQPLPVLPQLPLLPQPGPQGFEETNVPQLQPGFESGSPPVFPFGSEERDEDKDTGSDFDGDDSQEQEEGVQSGLPSDQDGPQEGFGNEGVGLAVEPDNGEHVEDYPDILEENEIPDDASPAHLVTDDEAHDEIADESEGLHGAEKEESEENHLGAEEEEEEEDDDDDEEKEEEAHHQEKGEEESEAHHVVEDIEEIENHDLENLAEEPVQESALEEFEAEKPVEEERVQEPAPEVLVEEKPIQEDSLKEEPAEETPADVVQEVLIPEESLGSHQLEHAPLM